eukprot:scaffold60990_cov49-Phaeocystis_antarctica.AAC.2
MELTARRPCALTMLATRAHAAGCPSIPNSSGRADAAGAASPGPRAWKPEAGGAVEAEADLGEGKKQGRGPAGLQDEPVRVDEHRGLREQIRVEVLVAFLMEDGAGGVREHV